MSQQMPGNQPMETPRAETWREKLDAVTRDVNARARELIQEGNQRRLVLERDGHVLANVPLTLAAGVGAVAVIFAPVAAVVGTVAALLARVRARVEPRR